MTTFAAWLSSFSPENQFSKMLRTYFGSGWAFLIPYLATYLLYAWLRWPVNAADSGVEVGSLRTGSRSWVPSLLHVYWALHAAHLILVGVALRAWWRSSVFKPQLPTSTGGLSASSPPTAHRLQSTGYRLLPWLCLALLFYIPGIYLEWPSDLWEHLRRINEWQVLGAVTEHSAWKKSSYFLPYSLTGHTMGLPQLSWLNFYYTAVCLLLSWQYYRLARAVGLSDRASFVFVLINALTFGNNIFSFYRYYGLSSSIFAQIGAVALTCIVLEAAQTPRLSLRALFRPQLTAYRLPLIAAAPALLVLIAFNHLQALGIAGLSIGAICIWRLIEWKRANLLWLAASAIILSTATVAWWPRHPLIDSTFRTAGWLNTWFGFDLLTWSSVAAGSANQIFGLVGLLNLLAGLWLLRSNRVIGWLTVAPVIGLMLPFISIPFTHLIAANNPGDIRAFNRLLLAVPSGLALVGLVQRLWRAGHPASPAAALPFETGLPGRTVLFPLILLLVSAAVTLPPANFCFNRPWHFLSRPADDLMFKPLGPTISAYEQVSRTDFNTRVITMSQPGYLLNIRHPGLPLVAYRHYQRSNRSHVDDFIALYDILRQMGQDRPGHALLVDPMLFYTAHSFAALESRHWPVHEIYLTAAGTLEMKTLGRESRLSTIIVPGGTVLLPRKTSTP